MAVNLSPVGGVAAQFFTNSGYVLTGGKLYTYSAGTTTPATTYTNSQGNVAWTNPIVLDAAGRVPGSGEIWLVDGANYKFVLKDSNDVLIATYDNISGINSNYIAYTNEQEIQTATAGQTVFTLTTMNYLPGTNSLSVFVDGVNQYGPGAQYSYVETNSNTVTFNTGLHVGAEVKFTSTQQQGAGAVAASQVSFTGFNGTVGNVQNLADNDGSDWIGFLQAGTGAVAISSQDKMRQIVSVLDFDADPTGNTDSSTAFANAIATGKAIYVPTGTYKASFNLESGQKIFGDGVVKTIIKPPSGATYVIRIDATAIAKQFCVVSDLSIQNLDAVANVTGILFKGVDVNSINDYHILNNLLIDNCNKGVEALGRLILNKWTSVRVLNSAIGVNINTDGTTPAFNLNEFDNCLFNYSVGEGFKAVGQSIANSFYSCNFEKNNTANAANKAGAYIEDSQNICFRGCYFEDNGYGLAANATITSNSYALRFAGTYCINPTVDCCYMAGSGAMIYVSSGAVTGGRISNTRLIANGLAGYAYYNAATQGGSKSVLVFDSTNYPYGNVYFGIGGGLTYSSAVNQNSSMDYLSGNTTLDLLVNKKITINAGAPFTFTTINNRLPSCELWISNLGADATIPAAMMASGVDLTITGGTAKILVVSGYPYAGKFTVMA